MLAEHTLDQLRTLRLDGMLRAIEEQSTSTAAAELSFEDRFTLLVQREIALPRVNLDESSASIWMRRVAGPGG
jgi:IstB-like ATP binding N-terminal.